MALKGTAFLALFNDIAPERDDEYNVWHSTEHVPERLTIPGITGARRYVNRSEQQFPYFTLYEMESTATMLSRPYLDLLANPTPWSSTMRPAFREFLRIPCKTLASFSEGVGGVLSIITLNAAEAPPEGVWPELCTVIAKLEGLTGAHAGVQDRSLPGPPGVKAAQALADTPTFVLMIEAQESVWLRRHSEAIRSGIRKGAPALELLTQREYALMLLLAALKPRVVSDGYAE